MVFTHDKRGQPIHPQVLEILNTPVPHKPKKRRAPSHRKLSIDADVVPNLSEVPGLEGSKSARKKICERVPCQDPLDAGRDNKVTASPETPKAAAKGPAARETDTHDAPKVPKRETNRFGWLKDMILKASPPLLSPIIETKEEVTPSSPANVPAPLQGELVPLSTYNVSETPSQPLYTPRGLRMNSNFYRVLAMEMVMCQKGKIASPSAQMFLESRPPIESPQPVFGIQPSLRHRRQRCWQDLSCES